MRELIVFEDEVTVSINDKFGGHISENLQKDNHNLQIDNLQIIRDGRSFLVSRSGVPCILGTLARGTQILYRKAEGERIGTLNSGSCAEKTGAPPLPHTLGETGLPINSGQVWPSRYNPLPPPPTP